MLNVAPVQKRNLKLEKTLINIINAGCGNFSSVRNWVNQYTSRVQIITNPKQYIKGPIILPGVSSSTQLMNNLRATGFETLLKELNSTGEKIIGICAGFQVLGVYTEEDVGTDCLNILPFKVSRLKDTFGVETTCTGWKKVNIKIKEQTLLKEDFKKKRVLRGEAYFNHEYGVSSNDYPLHNDYNYGISEGYYSHIINNNVYGFQFHPEKSSVFGRELLGILR